MVSFADVRDIDPFVFRQGESGWLDMYNNVKERGYEVRRVLDKLEGWTGAAAEGAKATFHEHERRLLASADTLYEGSKLFTRRVIGLAPPRRRSWRAPRKSAPGT